MPGHDPSRIEITSQCDSAGLTCKLCKMVLKDAVQLLCSDVVCRVCAETMCTQYDTCAVCSKPILTDLDLHCKYFVKLDLRNKVKSLVGRCTVQLESGRCRWSGGPSDWEQHVAECGSTLWNRDISTDQIAKLTSNIDETRTLVEHMRLQISALWRAQGIGTTGDQPDVITSAT